MKIVFVCEGNTCRSPMLEFMFKRYIQDIGRDDCVVESRGIRDGGERLSPYTATVLAAHAVPHCERISKKISTDDVNSADIIIALTAEIADELRVIYGTNKITALYEIAGYDISDPYGKGLEEYQKVYKALYESLPDIYNCIK